MYDDGMDELEKTGFLFKRGKASKVDPKPAWKKRWFELDLHSKQLKYYKHQSDISTKGDIPISGAILRILRPTEKLWRPRAFAISGPHTKREYFLQAKTQEDMEEWLKAITDAVNYLAETDRKNQMPETTGDLKSSAPLGGSNNPENMKKEEVKINLNLALPKTFFPLMSRMNAWRSVAALRGYVDHELVVETRTLERDLVPYTSCLAVRRGSNVTPDTGFFATGNSNPDSNRSPVTFFYPGTMQKETLRAEALRTDVTASCRCTDIDWRDNKLLCGTSAGQLRLYVTGVMGDGISVVKTRTFQEEEKKDYAKMKVAEYGEWGISQRISQCELNPKKSDMALCVSNTVFSLWNFEKPKKPIFSANGSSDALFACSWDVNRGASFIIAGQSRSLKILDGRKLNDLNKSARWKVADAHARRVTDVAWSPLVRWWIASAGADGDVKIWDLRSGGGEPVYTLSSHLSSINRIAWSRSHPEMLASAGVDRTLRLWNLRKPPRFLVHTQDDFATEVVGVDFSSTHPLKVHAVSMGGEAIELTMTDEFMTPFVQHRFKRPEEKGESVASPKEAKNAAGFSSPVSASLSQRSVTSPPPMRLQQPAPSSALSSTPALRGESKQIGITSYQQYIVTDEDLEKEKKVEHYLYTRDLKKAFQTMSELANRYYENKMNQRAIDLLKLASGSLFFKVLQQVDVSDAKIARFVEDVSYYLPSDCVRLSKPNEEDFKLIQLLKTRIALRTLIQTKAWDKIIDIKDEIDKQLSENGDAFSAQTLDDMVATILPESYLAGLNFAMTLGTKLKEKGTFEKNFVLIAKRLFFPTIYHGGRVSSQGQGSEISGSAQASNSTMGVVAADDLQQQQAGNSSSKMMESMEGENAHPSHDVKTMERKMEREFRNPLCIIPQLKLVNEVHMALSRAFTRSDAGSDSLYQPAEVVISVVEKFKEDKEIAPQNIYPSMVHRLYVNALIQRNKLDKVFVYATALSQAIRGWRFASMLDEILRDIAFPKLRQFFDLALLQDRRRPWECQRLVQATLMLLRILHSCEHLPQNLHRAAPQFMERFTARLRRALEEIYKNPRYDGSQTLEGVMDPNRKTSEGGASKVDSKRDAMDLVEYLKTQVMKIREHGRGHQPLHPGKVNSFRDTLDRIELAIKDGTLGTGNSRRTSSNSVRTSRRSTREEVGRARGISNLTQRRVSNLATMEEEPSSQINNKRI